ncbi:ribosomal protein S5 [Edhazardia aedis USNM 41457]|uniref:Small ribosomal subunit protein uS5 n=1 Tax=Edhazardia aedis (strain USNM 41457) TaxID=1003232 RepID=J9D897_EDHAE|nr:ribosomal protein S5 [Edhazardia aedis USNM 41457]|eukprot:EJW04001.1 ribosomal protein S5 [Edhazardia aedis USNM 41457]
MNQEEAPRASPRPRMRQEPIKDEWFPKTGLGFLVKQDMIDADTIFKFNIPIKEVEIIDHLFADTLKDHVLVIKSIQKQTKAGQRTRIKAVVAVGDCKGYIGLGVKAAKEAATAIRGALQKAKLNIRPVRLGHWGEKFGEEHTVPVKNTGKCGSVSIRVIPAPKGSGIRAAPVVKKIFQLAGVKDVFTNSKGNTATNENFVKAAVTALENASAFFTPDMWEKPEPQRNPLIEFSNVISDFESKINITQ